MKKIVVLQEEIADCGVCSLLSIIRYYGGNANLENLRIESNTTRDGVNAYNLIKCAKEFGFMAKGIKDNNLSSYHLPLIVHFKINKSLTHFVVLYEIKDNNFKIMDPSIGMRTLTYGEFYSYFTGYAILLEPIDKLPYQNVDNTMLRLLRKEIFKRKKTLISIIMLNILLIILSIISSFYINIFSYDDYILILSIMFILINIFIYLISYILNLKTTKLYMNVNHNINNYFLRYIIKLPIKYIHLKDPGEIVKRCEYINTINEVSVESILSIILNIMIILPILIIIALYKIGLLFILLLLFTINFLLTFLHINKLTLKSKELINDSTSYSNELIDYMYGLLSIKHNRCENILLDNLEDSYSMKDKSFINYQLYLRKINTIRECLNSISRIMINLFIMYDVLFNNLNLTYFVIIDFLFELFLNSSNSILSSVSSLMHIKNLVMKINEFLNISTKSNKMISSKMVDNSIKLENVNYKINGITILDNISFNISNGEKIVLRGESGRGKSTILKLLIGELDGYDGSILIGNENIKYLSDDYINKKSMILSQNEKLFNGTIKYNILLGRNISEDKFNKILKLCHIDRILKKRNLGLDTYLIGGYTHLSGGEEQLILLARTLVGSFDILYLDECLSKVNEDLEKNIINGLFDYYKEKTIIYVSHKMNDGYNGRILNV